MRERIREGESGGQIARSSSELNVKRRSLVAEYVKAIARVKLGEIQDIKTEEMSKWGRDGFVVVTSFWRVGVQYYTMYA